MTVLPAKAKVVRDLVPGDVLVVEEGDRFSADARLIGADVRSAPHPCGEVAVW